MILANWQTQVGEPVYIPLVSCTIAMNLKLIWVGSDPGAVAAVISEKAHSGAAIGADPGPVSSRLWSELHRRGLLDAHSSRGQAQLANLILLT